MWFRKKQTNLSWAGLMDQWIKALTAKTGNLTSITRTHMEGENWFLDIVL